MPVYRLTPIRDSERSPQWQASSIKPFCVWVRAESEYDARRTVACATATGEAEQTLAPWKDPELVTCQLDEGKSVAGGIIWIRKKPLLRVVRAEQRSRLSA